MEKEKRNMKLYCFYLKSNDKNNLYAVTIDRNTSIDFRDTRDMCKFIFDEMEIPNDDVKDFLVKNESCELRHNILTDIDLESQRIVIMTKNESSSLRNYTYQEFEEFYRDLLK